ncbi:MAG: alkaline phosphatase family protein, partial [Candidatus Hydrogenedens sp.]
MKINRRKFLFSSAVTLGLITKSKSLFASNNKTRVVLLGFDGAEPDIVKSMLEKKQLPNLETVMKQGCFLNLTSTIPPQSPTAWSSFATCKNPGEHGIYDFLRRDPKTYFPGLALGSVHSPEFDEQ